MSHKVVFIPQHELGLIEPGMHHIGDGLTKRDRATSFKRNAEVLRHLGIIERQADVHGLALGVQKNGDRGLFVVLDIPDHVVAARSAESTEGSP